jgi:hypothetical protein
MRIALTVMADIMVLVLALLAVTEYHALRRYATFTVPFTDRLIACGAVKPENRERILKEDRVLHVVGILLSVAVWIMLCRFFAGRSGLILFPVGVAALLLLLRPGTAEDDENREQYYRAHRRYIDDLKYHDYLNR